MELIFLCVIIFYPLNIHLFVYAYYRLVPKVIFLGKVKSWFWLDLNLWLTEQVWPTLNLSHIYWLCKRFPYKLERWCSKIEARTGDLLPKFVLQIPFITTSHTSFLFRRIYIYKRHSNNILFKTILYKKLCFEDGFWITRIE